MSESSCQSAICKKQKTGTKEWASHNVNFVDGCEHDCLYCYARSMARRFRPAVAASWVKQKVREPDVTKKRGKYNGVVMFPSSHDITPSILPQAIIVLKKLLEAGNDVLIVSKPHVYCIKAICSQMEVYKKQILFRFTIGSFDNDVLRRWEPNAPTFEERYQCLKCAFESGYKTSISIEPYLDGNVIDLVAKLEPFVTDAIWIGKMNGFRDDGSHQLYSNSSVLSFVRTLRHNKKIRFKDSITKVIENIKDKKGY